MSDPAPGVPAERPEADPTGGASPTGEADVPAERHEAGSLAEAGLPEAAGRRLTEDAFTSGLTVPDFAACLQMGLEPVGFVQGYCVMQWQWYGTGAGYATWGPSQSRSGAYSKTWRCPHGMVSAEHRSWGQNYEQTWIEQAWATGFSAARDRLVSEAAEAGAHGVVGVVDTVEPLTGMGVVEFRVSGTAVTVAGGPPPAGGRPWSTYLAGQRLAKLVEAGYAPVSVTAAVASVRVWAYCVTEYLTEGGRYGWGSAGETPEITQTVDAHMAARRLARRRVGSQLGTDSLHGAALSTTERELGQGDAVVECVLRGNRVRRFKEFDQVPTPTPTVRLW